MKINLLVNNNNNNDKLKELKGKKKIKIANQGGCDGPCMGVLFWKFRPNNVAKHV